MTIKYPNGVASTNRHMKPRKVTKHKKRGTGPEQLIQRGIIEVLTMAGPQAGFPDICGYRKSDGKMFFIEVKTKTGKRRPAQEYFAKEIARDPVIYGVARSAEEVLMIVTKGLNRTEDVK